MRTKFLTVLLVAGTVAACASNPPPPPPMADAPAPPPAPAPMVSGPMAGVYKGTPDLTADSGPRCAKMTRPVAVRVTARNTFSLAGLVAKIGPDGAITAPAKRGQSLMGMASATGLDVTTVKGACTYKYSLAKS